MTKQDYERFLPLLFEGEWFTNTSQRLKCIIGMGLLPNCCVIAVGVLERDLAFGSETT